MKFSVNIDQENIVQALTNHLTLLGVDTTGKEVSVDLTAGRGSNGFSADITVSDEPAPKATKTTKAKAAKKAEPKTEVDEAAVKEEVVAEPAPEAEVETEATAAPSKSLFATAG